MLSPRWAQLKIGPLIRGESDLRLYFNLFRPGVNDVRGIRKLRLELFSKVESEDDAVKTNGTPTIRVFDGEQDRFRTLNGWDQFLYAELRAITRKRWLAAADRINNVPIGIHVRMGDFSPTKSEAELELAQRRVPLSWFVNSLRVIREAVGFKIPAFVVSDGKENELGELLEGADVSLVRTGSAISDLLVLAKSRALIAASGSSFGAWAAFLGQMPAIAHPAQSFDWFHLENRNDYYVGGFDPERPAADFLDQVILVFKSQGIRS